MPKGFKGFQKGENYRRGAILSEITKKKISQSEKGKIVSRETRIKISEANKGKKRTEKTKVLLSKIQKGKHHSPKTEFKKGLIPWNKGKKLPQIIGRAHPHWKGGPPKCIDCGKTLKGYKAKRCLQCIVEKGYRKGRIGELHPMWKGGLPKCKICGNKLAGYSAKICRYCWKNTCKGENHPNWQGGISINLYPKEFNSKLKFKIRQRDNFTCCLCGKTEREELEELNQVLSVNHKNFDKNDCREENLNTLCIRCNVKINRNRDYWINYFNKKYV